jgi:hypothetical protein
MGYLFNMNFEAQFGCMFDPAHPYVIHLKGTVTTTKYKLSTTKNVVVNIEFTGEQIYQIGD